MIFRKIINLLLAIIFFLGLSLIIYPSFSNYWNLRHQSKAIAAYAEKVTDLNEKEYAKILNDAKAYNQTLCKENFTRTLSDSEKERYGQQLNINGSGIMGTIEIPDINVFLPIYHGTSQDILQVAVGHLEGTSLPVGGNGTHCVLSGHRGLPSAKLFTDLDKLDVGDHFTLRVLNENLTYEVDQVQIVKPEKIEALRAERGKDYCTLVTCTPYGINSHRLLVRGSRITEATEQNEREVTGNIRGNVMNKHKSIIIKTLLIALFLLIFCLLAPLKSKAAKRTDPNKKISLTILHNVAEEDKSEVEFYIYQVAVILNKEFELTKAFQNCKLSLEMGNPAELGRFADVLQSYVTEEKIKALDSSKTDENGAAVFSIQENLEPGIYLILGKSEKTREGKECNIQPVLISLPATDESGRTLDDVKIETKYEIVNVPAGNKDVKLPQTGTIWWPAYILMIAGFLMLSIAFLFVLYNIRDDSRAGEQSNKILVQLTSAIERNSEKMIDNCDCIGILSIPSLNLELPVMDDWSYERLKLAPCRYMGTVYENNLIICAHNYNSHFGTLKLLEAGDVVRLTDVKGTLFVYEAAKVELLDSHEVEEMACGDWNLTLFTCVKGGTQRIAVRCVLKEIQ